MYNENKKQDFVIWYSAIISPNYLPNLFNKTEVYEMKYDLDISNFDLQQIIDLLKSFSAPSINSLRIVVSILRTYTKWCIEQNLGTENQNSFDEITTDTLKTCVNKILVDKKYISPEQLAAYADGLINVCDKCILYAIHEGIKGENYCELLTLREEDLNTKDMTINLCTGRTIKASKELMQYAVNSAKEYQYYSTREDSFFISDLKSDSNLVVKPRNNIINETPEGAYHRLLKRIFKIKSELEVSELTLPRLYNSGILNAISKGAITQDITTTDFLETPEFLAIKEQYDFNKPLFQIRGMYQEYLK